MSFGAVDVMALSGFEFAFTSGEGTIFHLMPFHRSVNVRQLPVGQLDAPSAQTFCLPFATTLVKTVSREPTFGLGTTAHEEPFQCSINVARTPGVRVLYEPTAHTSVDELAATALSPWLVGPGSGVATAVQLEPFQCRSE